MHLLVKHAKAVVVVLIMKGATIEAARGEDLLKSMTSVLRMFNMPQGVLNAKVYLVPLLNNVSLFKSTKSIKASLKKHMNFIK